MIFYDIFMLFILPFLFLQTSLMGITETVENEPLAFALEFSANFSN